MRALRWVAWGAGALVLVAGVSTFAMWPRDDVPRDPDAVVVLGGAGKERARLGIELRDRYDASLVLSTSAINFAREEGVGCGPNVICIFRVDPENTIGEARRVAEFADEHGWDHVTVVTTRFHTTRARILFRQCLGDDVSVVGAVAPPGGGRGLRTYLEETVGTIAGLTFRRAC
jgi:uncharacterized SAM-binding protein YcdF (DUF218 family)